MLKRLLTYCTLIGLSILLLGSSGSAQISITSPSNGDVSDLQSVFVAGIAPAGQQMLLEVNGTITDTTVVRPDGKFEFIGVNTPLGPVQFRTILRFANGTMQTAMRRIHVVGAPDSIRIRSLTAEQIADGRTPVSLKIDVVDKWGYNIAVDYFLTVEADSLKLNVIDVDPATPGIQVRLHHGTAVIEGVAPRQAGSYSVRFAMNDLTANAALDFSTPIQPLMLVGSVDGTASSLSTTGDLSQLNDRTSLSNGLHGDGRVAFYGRGSVWGDYLLTASYDNTRRQQDRLFKELDPDVLYSIYGDNSTVDYTAQTSSAFFAKLERNRSNILFGDFNTAFGQNELARYDRTFTGVRGHYENKTESADVFATLTDRAVRYEEIRGQGISGFYFLAKSNIVEGSEKVRIETRDKYHNEVVLSRAEKGRFGDYDIDYQQGTLYFKQPVTSLDASGNPVYIVITYESSDPGMPTNYVAGAQGEQEIMNGLRIGATAVTEQSQPKNYMLLGFNTKYKIDKMLSLNGEYAHGSNMNSEGSAWRVDGSLMPIEKLQLKSYYNSVEAGFVNQTMGAGGISSEQGSRKYGVGGSYDGLASMKIGAEYYHSLQKADNGDATINSVKGSVDRAISSIATIGVNAEHVTYDNAATNGTITSKQSTILGAKTSVKPTDRLTLSGQYEQSMGSSEADQVKPSATTLGAEYRVFDPVSLSLSQMFYGNGGNATLFGVSSDLGYGTTATARYSIGNAISGARNQMSIGLKNTLKVTDELTSNVSYERTRSLQHDLTQVQTENSDAVSAGLEYLPKAWYKASVKGEYAKTDQGEKYGFNFGGDVRLNTEFTLIDKFTYYKESRTIAQNIDSSNTFSGNTLAPEQIGTAMGNGSLNNISNIVGIAFRPVKFDWLNAIGKFEKKYMFNGMVSPRTSSDVSIVSLHTFIEPIERLEIGTKYAMKYAKEEAFGLSATTLTDFYLVRAEYDLNWKTFDVAAEYRLLNQREANNSKSGYSAEVGYGVFQNVRIGVGYNFVGTYDRDLVGYNYWSQGPFVTVRAKFTEKIMEMFNK